MAKKKPLTKKQKRILQRRRRRRILFGIEIFILLILIGGVWRRAAFRTGENDTMVCKRRYV